MKKKTATPYRSAAAKKAHLRDRLSEVTKKKVNGTGKWLEDPKNADALELVETWLEMAAEGDTDWSLAQLHRELRAQHRYPFTSGVSMLKWLQSYRGEAYGRVVGVRG